MFVVANAVIHVQDSTVSVCMDVQVVGHVCGLDERSDASVSSRCGYDSCNSMCIAPTSVV